MGPRGALGLSVALAFAGCQAPLDAPDRPDSRGPTPAVPPASVEAPEGDPALPSEGPVQDGPGGPDVSVGGPDGGRFDFRFIDATRAAGVSSPHGWVQDYFTTGQAFGDYDGDGWIDLYLTDSVGPNTLYRNRGDGTFEVAAQNSQVDLPTHVSGGAIFVDYDNDGDPDLYVLGLGPNVLFENDGGDFVDVSREAGVADPGKGQTASFGDYDNDGWLDLYVANWLCHECDIEESWARRTDRLFHNEGDGTFRDVTVALGRPFTDGYGFVAGWLDYDEDGDLDIYLVNDKGYADPRNPRGAMNRNALWRNDGPGCEQWCFSEVAIETGSDARLEGMGLAVGDYDNDLDLDLLFTNTGPARLLTNEGGVFHDVAEQVGLRCEDKAWGTVFFDHDNDGDLDVYIAIGGQFGPVSPNLMFDNLGDGTFADISEQSGANYSRYTIGVATADVDRDGGVDLVIGNWAFGYRLLKNAFAARTGHHWLTVRLVGGGRVNRDAVGARVYVDTTDGRRLMQQVAAGTSNGSGNDLALHFGLGEALVAGVDVVWPDGLTERVSSVPVDAEWVHAHPE